MVLLIAGLVIFLGVHSIRIFAEDWRTERIRRMGAQPWKAVYSIVSIAGFVILVWGYAHARHDTAALWVSPYWTRHLTAILVLLSFILIAAAYVPGTRMKAAIGHPMLAGTVLWALGHLLSNGTLADVVLFGAFLVWAVLDFAASRARDRKAGVTYPARDASRDVIAVVAGGIAWAVFGMFLHGPLIGVRVFG
jgi:uncharacterized membrane protein